MSFVEINWNPTRKQLRQFGAVALVALPLVGWIWGAGNQFLLILATVGTACAVTGLIAPALLKPVFLGLTILAAPIGLVVSEVVMLLMYFLVFLPIGLLMRVVGRNSLDLKVDRSADTYWREKSQPHDVASYYRQS